MATIDVDVFTLTGTSRTTTAATINGLTLDTTNPSTMTASIASMEAAAGSETAQDSDPGAGGSDVLITVNTGSSRDIDPLYFGFNIHNRSLRSPAGGSTIIDVTSARFEALMNTMPVGLVRYLGGPDDIYWDPTNTENRFNPPGTYDEVMRQDDLNDMQQMLADIGKGELYVGVNLQRNDFADWEDVAQEIVAQGWSIESICGGNESNSRLSAAAYVTRWEGYMDEFTTESADFIYGAPECTKNAVDAPAWTESVLSTLLADGYDLAYITAHTHQLNGRETDPTHPYYSTLANLLSWPSNDPPTYADDRGTAKYYEVRIATLAGLRNTYYPDAKVLWTEYGPSLGFASPYTNSQEVFSSVGTALWAADLLGRAARVGCDGMLYYTLCLHSTRAAPSGYPSMLFHNDLNTLYPLYYTYLLYGQWWGDDWVTDVTSDDEEDLSVNASIDDDYIYIMLVNKTAGTDHTIHATITHAGTTWYIAGDVDAHSVVVYRFELPTTVTPDPSDNFDYWLTDRITPGVA